MPKLDAKKCDICKKLVNMIGSYVQLSPTKHAHVSCLRDQIFQEGYNKGRNDLILEQEQERRQREENERIAQETRRREEEQEKINEEVRIRNYVSTLPRCSGCGRRVNEEHPHRRRVDLETLKVVDPDVQGPSAKLPHGRAGLCFSCAESERVARNDARKPEPKPPEPKKEEAPKKDRFDLIEVE